MDHLAILDEQKKESGTLSEHQKIQSDDHKSEDRVLSEKRKVAGSGE